MSVSVVIPVQRDDRVIATVGRLRAWAEQRDIALRTIVVGEAGMRPLPEGVAWIAHRPARKGRCSQIGARATQGDCVILADADLPVPDSQLDAVVAALADCDVAFGNRWTPPVRSMRYPRALRTAASWTFAFLVRGLFDTPDVDTQCGLKAFRRPAFAALFERRWLEGLAATVETVVRARRARRRVANARVGWSEQSGTTLVVWRAVLEMVVDIVRLKLLLRLEGASGGAGRLPSRLAQRYPD